MTDKTKRGWKYHAIRILLVALVLALGVNFCYGPFWSSGNFVNWKQTDVLRSLGPPDSDSRDIDGGEEIPGQAYTLSWNDKFGGRLTLHFSADGIVRAEQRSSK
jgi:hypothetical protein